MRSRVILPIVGRAVEFAAMTFHKSRSLMHIPGSSAGRYLRAMLITGMLLAAWHPSRSAGAADSSSAPGHEHEQSRFPPSVVRLA
jgi:hypothetical protein